MTAPPAGALEACLALAVEQLDMLRDDFASYSEGKATVPFVVLRDALVAALNAYDEARPALLAALRLRKAVRQARTELRLMACDLQLLRPNEPLSVVGRKHYAERINATADDLARALEEGE